MCAYLMGLGFTPYKIAPDRDNPVFDVYLFTATPELYDAVLSYTTKNNLMKEGNQNEHNREESL